MASGIVDIFPHTPVTVLLSSFSPCLVHLSKNIAIQNALESPERIFTMEAPKPHLLQSKEGEGTAEKMDCSVEDSFQKLDADPEQWRQELHICGKEEPVRKGIMSLPSEFASMWSGSLGKITTAKHHIHLQPTSRPAFRHPYRAR